MTQIDIKNAGNGNTNPLRSGFLITPSDTDELAAIPRQILVGNTAGDIRCIFADDPDNKILTLPVAANTEHPWQLRKVFATGTTATTLHGMY